MKHRTLATALVTAGLMFAAGGQGWAEETAQTTTSSTASSTIDSTSTAGDRAVRRNTTEVVKASQKFLATLSDKQRRASILEFDDPARKKGWSNYPTVIFERTGVALGDLNRDQRRAALGVLKAALSQQGYVEVHEILAADENLSREVEEIQGVPGTEIFGSEYYYLAFYGTPSTESPFAVQFGGHHLARNLTYTDDAVSMTPAFTGTEPVSFFVQGKRISPMADERAILRLVGRLTPQERAVAELPEEYEELALGATKDGPFPAASGQLVSELSQVQQDRVTETVRAYVGDLDERAAAGVVETYIAEYDRTYVGWAGATSKDDPKTYVRIQGPRLWIELSNESEEIQGATSHHSVYRDQTDDYGAR